MPQSRRLGGSSILALIVAMTSAAPMMAQTQTGDSSAETVIDEIIVTGRAQTLYNVSETTSGKLPTNPLNSTQIVTAIAATIPSASWRRRSPGAQGMN